MIQRIKQAVRASFVADALALGVHWVYRVSDIDEKYGRLESMTAPEIARWHRGKNKGAFTHYGDQSLVLLKSLAKGKKFDLNQFALDWQTFFQNYSGYIDQATRETLTNFSADKPPQETGSFSSDLGGASRMVPLAAFYHDQPDAFIAACRDQTRMTHNHPDVLASAELFARALLKVLAGEKPSEGIRTAANAMAAGPQIMQAVEKGLASKHEDTRKTIAGFGQECSIEAALPGTIHLVAKYQDNLKKGLVENIMAGGDSSARGMFLGFLLGAYHEPDAVPEEWLKDMIHTQEIDILLG